MPLLVCDPQSRSVCRWITMSDGQARTLKYITLLQHGSATFLSVFLAVHVSAPAAALIGGSASGSNVMVRVLSCLLPCETSRAEKRLLSMTLLRYGLASRTRILPNSLDRTSPCLGAACCSHRCCNNQTRHHRTTKDSLDARRDRLAPCHCPTSGTCAIAPVKSHASGTTSTFSGTISA